MERRFFLTTLFKGVVASTIVYSLPIIGKEFSEVIPTYINTPRLTESEIIALELDRMRPKMASLFDRDDYFYKALEAGSAGGGKTMRIPLQIRPGKKWKI